jgi:hypothetical protein
MKKEMKRVPVRTPFSLFEQGVKWIVAVLYLGIDEFTVSTEGMVVSALLYMPHPVQALGGHHSRTS